MQLSLALTTMYTSKKLRQIVTIFISFLTICATTMHIQKSVANEIEITHSSDAPIKIAVVPFTNSNKYLSDNLASLISANLAITGHLAILPEKKMISYPTNVAQIIYRDWEKLDVQFVIIGKVSRTNNISIQIEVIDILLRKVILSQNFLAAEFGSQAQSIADNLSNYIYQSITGIPGIFTSSLAFVSFSRTDNKYRLQTMDIHGHKVTNRITSSKPIMSPTWHPDGTKIAYAAFIEGHSQIYIYNLLTKQNQQITHFQGLNNSPTWSHSGNLIAYTSSKNGNPDIYIYNLQTNKTTQITHNPAIDTEADWSQDDNKLLFTSNRHKNKAQIYEYNLLTQKTVRVTNTQSNYSRPLYTKYENKLIMISSSGYFDTLVLQNLKTQQISLLSEGYLVDSPSVAANGYQFAYTMRTREGSNVLIISAVNALASITLQRKDTDILYPSWGPLK